VEPGAASREVVQRDGGEGEKVSQLRFGVLIERPRVAWRVKMLSPLVLLLLVRGHAASETRQRHARWIAAIGTLLAVIGLHLSYSASFAATAG